MSTLRVACHQPNFIPWFPFFYKMAMVDMFIFLEHVQFEKNGYQNRFNYKGKWITKPVESGINTIHKKKYVNNKTVGNLNGDWIRAIKDTLNIKTKWTSDYMPSDKKGTDRLIELVKWVGGTTYITNPSAKDKYLDEDLIRSAGIEIEYCKVPKHLQRSTFEIIEEYGIEGAIKQLPRELCKV